ncbi:hypothetical protein ACHAQJ_009517 [Trichoderma viride]
MKPLGSDHGLGGSSPAQRNPVYGWTAKGADLDDMLLLVPESGSPKTTKDYRIKDWSQVGFNGKEEISEASLAEGFTFLPREPPRPGQFSNIPRHNSFANPLNTQLSGTCQNVTNTPPKDKIPTSLARASPLNLPELCLPGTSTDIGCDIAEVPQQSELISMFSMHAGHSDLKDLSSVRSGSLKNAEETNTSNRLLSPPKITSSPVQSRYQELPTATDHKAAPYRHDEPYHAPRQPSHTKPVSSNGQCQPPPSTCGDLEPPTYRNPTKSLRHHHKQPANRPVHRSSTKGHKQQLSRHRSTSLASSNMSKKIARVHHRSSSIASSNISKNIEEFGEVKVRKQYAYHRFAESWNECLLVQGEEAAIEAHGEIERLRGDIQRQEAELGKSRSLLDDKETKLCEAEKLYKVLLEEDTRVLGDNKNLNLEITSLRQQLSEEKKRAELLKEKHQESRSRLNEAIKEQQDLFSRSRDLCQETVEQLRKEKVCKSSLSDAVDKALEISHKKREEMKKCLQEYRLQTEKDTQQKDQIISELKEQLNLQETLLAQEKSFADKLRAQAEEQSIAHECVRTLEAKVDALMAQHAAQGEQRGSDIHKSTQMMEVLNSRLDCLIGDGKLIASNMLSRDDLEVRLGISEKNVMESILPIILTLERGQKDTTDAMILLGASIQRDLNHLKDETTQLTDTWKENKEGNSMQVQKLLNQMQQLNDSLKTAENTCEQIGQKVDALVDNEQSSQRTTDTLLQDFTRQFLAREVRLDDIECRLQQTYEDFTTKTETMIAGALNDGKESTKLVCDATTELRNVVEQGFGQERESAAQLLLESGNITKALTAHIDEHKQPITQTDHKTHELRATLQSEHEAAVQLTRKLQTLEQKAQESEVLRDRWLREIQTVEMAREQMKAILEQTSPVETYDKKLDRIVEINRSIQSSTSYLATENQWVQQELAARIPKPSIETDKNLPALSTISNGMTENRPLAKEDAACRKVTVHSPDSGEGSPSPPPTVMQEQKRRREITQLRSILKSHVQSGAIESGSIEGPSVTLQVNPSKPPGQFSNTSLNKKSSFSSKEMVAEICSRMVRQDWSFPTVADFERDIQLAGKKREAPQSDLMSLQTDNTNHRDAKKLKTECFITE